MSNRLKERAALVDENAMLKSKVTLLGNACEAYTSEIVRLRSEVDRLRLTASEVGRLRQISTYLNNKGFAGYTADIDAVLQRQGGGE